MSNHYHLLIETPDGNLSQGMRQLNGVYTQHFIAPTNGQAMSSKGDIKPSPSGPEWSVVPRIGLGAVIEQALALQAHLNGLVRTGCYQIFPENEKRQLSTTVILLRKVKNQPSPWEQLKNHIFLGDEQFVEDMQCKLNLQQDLNEIPRAQRRKVPRPLSYYAENYKDRNEAIESVELLNP